MYELNQLIELFSRIREEVAQNQLEEAIIDIQYALKGFAALGAHEWYVRAMNMMGVVYAFMENEGMAVSCYLEGLEYADEHGVKAVSSILYNNIGARFFALSDYKKASYYYQVSEEHLLANGPVGTVVEEEYYQLLITTKFNAISCCLHNQEYELSKKHLREVKNVLKDHSSTQNLYLYEIYSCCYEWYTGNLEYTRKRIPQVIQNLDASLFSAYSLKNIIADLALLLKQMRMDNEWLIVLEFYHMQADHMNSISMRQKVLELKMDYYDITGAKDLYEECCIKLFELLEKAKELNNSERVRALNMKIDLRTAEKNVQAAEGKSEHDSLTGLKNRRAMNKWITNKIQEVKNIQGQIAIGLADIDCFKMLNDTYGHLQGDRVLKEVAMVLSDCLEGVGEVFRFGGDEFVILLHSGEVSGIEEVASCVLKRVNRKKIKNENSFVLPFVTMSIGFFVTKIDEGADMDELIDKADTVLYEVKKHGRNNFRIYHSMEW